jgi:L-rhamnonate dehydratase
MKITDVVLFRISGRYTGPQFATGSRQAKALDIYPEFNIDGDTGISERPISALYVEIQTDEGVSGIFGPIEEPNAFTIRHLLRPYLIGRDPLATELISDQMLRMDRHGKSGYFVTGASAIDIALWDLKGKAWGQPVYRLLGGPTRPAVPAYASMLGFSTAPEDAGKLAAEYKAKGYAAQKWFFRYGPGDGAAGMAKNLAMAEAVRAAVGSLYDVMFDAFWGWDLAYATKMVQELAHLTPRWMEEPIPPERVGGFVQLRAASTVPIATGEHVYTRWQVKELLANGAVDVLQNDPDTKCRSSPTAIPCCPPCTWLARSPPLLSRMWSFCCAIRRSSSSSRRSSIVPKRAQSPCLSYPVWEWYWTKAKSKSGKFWPDPCPVYD